MAARTMHVWLHRAQCEQQQSTQTKTLALISEYHKNEGTNLLPRAGIDAHCLCQLIVYAVVRVLQRCSSVRGSASNRMRERLMLRRGSRDVLRGGDARTLEVRRSEVGDAVSNRC